MIPIYLVGKSAVQIIDEINKRFFKSVGHVSMEAQADYIRNLEYWLCLALGDALCNCDEVKELIQEGEYLAQQRAIAFLNLVLPKGD